MLLTFVDYVSVGADYDYIRLQGEGRVQYAEEVVWCIIQIRMLRVCVFLEHIYIYIYSMDRYVKNSSSILSPSQGTTTCNHTKYIHTNIYICYIYICIYSYRSRAIVTITPSLRQSEQSELHTVLCLERPVWVFACTEAKGGHPLKAKQVPESPIRAVFFFWFVVGVSTFSLYLGWSWIWVLRQDGGRLQSYGFSQRRRHMQHCNRSKLKIHFQLCSK